MQLCFFRSKFFHFLTIYNNFGSDHLAESAGAERDVQQMIGGQTGEVLSLAGRTGQDLRDDEKVTWFTQ